MKKEFLINIIFLIFINLLIKPFYIFGIDRTVQNVTGSSEYGLFFLFFNFTYLFQIINDFGLTNFNNRSISQDRSLIKSYFPQIMVLKGILGLVFIILAYVIAIWTGYVEDNHGLFLGVAINHILLSLVLYFRSNISGLGMYRLDSFFSIVDKLLMIFVCGFLLWGPWREGFNIYWFVYAQTGTLLLTAFIILIVLFKHLNPIRFQWNGIEMRSLIRKSLPFALVVFLMTIYTRIDAVMIKYLLSDGIVEASAYAGAYRLLDASNMIGFLFAGLLLPMFSRMLKIGEQVNELVRFSLQIIWAVAIPLGVVSYFFRKEIMMALYTEGTEYWGSILGFLMVSFIAVTGSYIYGTLLTANGSLKKMNIIFAVSIIINVVFNYFLILKFKAMGAAAVTLGTQFFVFFAQVLLSLKEVKLKIHLPIILRLSFYSLCVIAMTYLVYYFIPGHWLIKFAAALMTGGLSSIAFQMLRPRIFMDILKSRDMGK